MENDKKLKIILINRWLGYNYGGNESHMKELITWFTKKGHEVTVITTKGEALEDYKEVKKYYISAPRGYYTYGPFGALFAVYYLIKCFFKFTQIYFKGERFDIQAIHFSLEAVLARFVKLFFGIPYVYVIAGDTHLEMIEGKRADGVVHISKFMLEQGKKFNHEAEIIPKGIDLKRFNPNHYSKELTNLHRAHKNQKIILTVCRLDPRKNLINLLEAMNIIVNVNENKKVSSLIIGNGEERKFLSEKIKMYNLNNYVKLLGNITDKELPNYFATADLFVLPTLYETFGWVYIESMASGTPVLTTNVGSVPEVVDRAGLLIEPKNPGLLADAIEKILFDEKVLGNLKRIGLKRAKMFDWENIIKQYEKYYLDVSKRKCNSISCKISTLFYICYDFLLIVKVLFTEVLFKKETRRESVWVGTGQVGYK